MRTVRESIRTPQRKQRESEQKKPTRYYSKKQEDAVAESLSGNRQKNSGATAFQKGDVSLEDFLVECKTKTKPSDSIAIKKEWLTKIQEESLFMGKRYGMLVFDFGDGDRYVVLQERDFKEIALDEKSG